MPSQDVRRGTLLPRFFAPVALLALVMAACGGDDSGAGATTTSGAVATSTAAATTVMPTTAPAGTTIAPATTSPPTTAPGATAAPEVTGSGGCREIVHALGTACVPASPERVVSLDALTVLPTLLEVGVVPVGSVSVYDVGDPFQDYLDPEQTAGITTLGSMQTPNLEAIAALEPDVIVGTDLVIEPIYEQLSQIAPTVATRYAFYFPDWQADARLAADAVGKSAEFDAAVAELDARATSTAAALAAKGAPFTVSRVDMFAGTPLYYRFGCVWFGGLLESVGLVQPDAQHAADCTPGDYQSVIQYPSLEQLEVLDADVIVAYQQQAQGADVGSDPLSGLAASPIWQTLPAVQDGRVYVVGDAWGLGASVTAAERILDDLVAVVFP